MRLSTVMSTLVLLLAPLLAWGQLSIKEKYEPYEPIVITAETEAQIYLWRLDKPAQYQPITEYKPATANPDPAVEAKDVLKAVLTSPDFGKLVERKSTLALTPEAISLIPKLAGDAAKLYERLGQRTIHVWAPPGTYEVQLTTITVDWELRVMDAQQHIATFTVGADPNPPPPPNPPPDPPKPVTGFESAVKTAVEKVSAAERDRQISVTMPDGNKRNTTVVAAIAANYADIASAAKGSPTSWDPALMMNEAKQRMAYVLPPDSLTAWRSFFSDLANALVALKLNADDLDGHIKAFEGIVKVLGDM